MQRILQTAEQYAWQLRIACSPTKSVILANWQISQLLVPLSLNGIALPIVATAKYLGIIVPTEGIDPKAHVEMLMKKGWAAYSHDHRSGLN